MAMHNDLPRVRPCAEHVSVSRNACSFRYRWFPIPFSLINCSIWSISLGTLALMLM